MDNIIFKAIVLSIIFVLGNLFSAQAETIHISGKIADKVSGKALSQTTVYINDLQNGTIDSVYSNINGLWEYDLAVTSINGEPGLPITFRVSQNYPNPFNPSTRIDLSIPESGEVQVTVFNALGEKIDAHRDFLQPGNYSIDWNSKGSSGIYFIQIKTGQGSITRKMIQLDGGQGSGLSRFQRANVRVSHATGTLTSIPVRIRASKFAYIDHSVDSEVSGGEYFEIALESIHHHYTMIDLHNDILVKMIDSPSYHLADWHSYNHTDIPRLQEGGVDVQFFVVWVDPSHYLQNSYQRAMDMIDLFQTELSLNEETIAQAGTFAQSRSINDQNKIAAVLAVEGGHAIENDIAKLKAFHQTGMRYLTITWNNSLDWAVSAQDSRSATVGLSDFGRKVIRTLDTLGVIIDVSHTGIKTIEDILEVTQNPIIATHSGVRALRNHYRNLYDYQIQAIANSGGVIGVVFYPPFLTSGGPAYISTVADHIDYIVNLVGIDYAAIGSDFDGIGTNTVIGLEDVSKFPDLTLELLNRGYTNAEVEKILGANFRRVFEQVCGD